MGYGSNSIGVERPESVVADKDCGLGNVDLGILGIVGTHYGVALIGGCSWVGYIHCPARPVVFEQRRRDNVMGRMMEEGTMRKLLQILMGR